MSLIFVNGCGRWGSSSPSASSGDAKEGGSGGQNNGNNTGSDSEKITAVSEFSVTPNSQWIRKTDNESIPQASAKLLLTQRENAFCKNLDSAIGQKDIAYSFHPVFRIKGEFSNEILAITRIFSNQSQINWQQKYKLVDEKQGQFDVVTALSSATFSDFKGNVLKSEFSFPVGFTFQWQNKLSARGKTSFTSELTNKKEYQEKFSEVITADFSKYFSQRITCEFTDIKDPRYDEISAGKFKIRLRQANSIFTKTSNYMKMKCNGDSIPREVQVVKTQIKTFDLVSATSREYCNGFPVLQIEVISDLAGNKLALSRMQIMENDLQNISDSFLKNVR